MKLVTTAALALALLSGTANAQSTFRAETDASNVWLRHKINGATQYQYRLGAGGGIADLRHTACGNMSVLAPPVATEVTGRVIQLVTWDQDRPLPGLPPNDENSAWNVNQAGTWNQNTNQQNLFQTTVQVIVNAAKTQVDIYSVADLQWREELRLPAPNAAFAGRISMLTRYGLQDDGTLTIRRVAWLGTPRLRPQNGSQFQDLPWVGAFAQHFVPLNGGFASNRYDTITKDFNPNGSPQIFHKFLSASTPDSSDNSAASATSGFTAAFDGKAECSGQRRYAGVIYGKGGVVQDPNGAQYTASWQRLIRARSFPTVPSMSLIAPALKFSSTVPVLNGPGIVLDSTVKFVTGPEIGTARARFDGLVPTIPAPALYRPGHAFTGELATIVSKLQANQGLALPANAPGRTNTLGPLVQ